MTTQSGVSNAKKAATLYEEAMAAYQRWDLDQALHKLESALRLTPDNADYHMAMAQVLARMGDFDRALKSLANFLRLEPDSPIAPRIEQLFARGMDPVEEALTRVMSEAHLPIELIGAAIQLWLEFRIIIGTEQLVIRKPEVWAAALDYTVRKVNLRDAPLTQIAALYGVSPESVRANHQRLVKELDIMPCDYRYFTGDQNPLDKLVEAADLLEQLEARFREE